MDLAPYNVVIVVFGMPECPACEAFIPRLARVVGRRRGLHVYQPGRAMPRGVVPVLIYDLASADAEVQALADRYAIESTPTTLVLKRGPGTFKVEGGLDDAQLDHLLNLALEAR